MCDSANLNEAKLQSKHKAHIVISHVRAYRVCACVPVPYIYIEDAKFAPRHASRRCRRKGNYKCKPCRAPLCAQRRATFIIIITRDEGQPRVSLLTRALCALSYETRARVFFLAMYVRNRRGNSANRQIKHFYITCNWELFIQPDRDLL